MGYKFFFLYATVLLMSLQASDVSWHISFPMIGKFAQRACYPFLPHLFSLEQLAPRQGKGSLVALIDGQVVSPISSNNIKKIELEIGRSLLGQSCKHLMGHGAFLGNLIVPLNQHESKNSLAPEAILYTINAFDACGMSSKKIIMQALQQAIDRNVDIVCMGLKFDGFVDSYNQMTQQFESLLTKIPYLVAASGNDEAQEAYPARLSIVPFDVGAFYFDGQQATIPAFSSFGPSGPLFVMPGVNILSIWPVQNSLVARSGTSIAAAIMTGIVGLIVSEFKDDFTRKEIITACYCSALKMHDNADWRKKVILGVLDARLALFILHVIRHMRTLDHENDFLKKYNFLHLCFAIRHALLEPAQLFNKSVSFENSFIDYWTMAQLYKKNDKQYEDFARFSLQDALGWTIQMVKNNSINFAHEDVGLSEAALKRVTIEKNQ